MSKAKVLLIILPFSLIGVIISICSIFRDHHWQGAPEFVDFISRRFFTRVFCFTRFPHTRCPQTAWWLFLVKGSDRYWRVMNQRMSLARNPTLLDFYHGNLRVTPTTSMPSSTSRKIRPLSDSDNDEILILHCVLFWFVFFLQIYDQLMSFSTSNNSCRLYIASRYSKRVVPLTNRFVIDFFPIWSFHIQIKGPQQIATRNDNARCME